MFLSEPAPTTFFAEASPNTHDLFVVPGPFAAKGAIGYHCSADEFLLLSTKTVELFAGKPSQF